MRSNWFLLLTSLLLLKGPYYRYRTYRDYFDTPFKDHALNVEATIEKLKSAGIYCVLYLIANYLYPLSVSNVNFLLFFYCISLLLIELIFHVLPLHSTVCS